jgi:hypothetical protein
MLISQQRKLTILTGCMSILEEGDTMEDIMFAIDSIIKLEQMTGEIYLKIETDRAVGR